MCKKNSGTYVSYMHVGQLRHRVIQSLGLGCRHYLIFLGDISKESDDGHWL